MSISGGASWKIVVVQCMLQEASGPTASSTADAQVGDDCLVPQTGRAVENSAAGGHHSAVGDIWARVPCCE